MNQPIHDRPDRPQSFSGGSASFSSRLHQTNFQQPPRPLSSSRLFTHREELHSSRTSLSRVQAKTSGSMYRSVRLSERSAARKSTTSFKPAALTSANQSAAKIISTRPHTAQSSGYRSQRDLQLSERPSLIGSLPFSSRSVVKSMMDPTVAKTLYALNRYLQLRNLKSSDIVRFKPKTGNQARGAVSPYFTTQEFEQILMEMDLGLSQRQLRDTSYYLDKDGTGEIDPLDLEEAVRKAKRQAAPRDPMSKIADIVRKDPFASILSMTSSEAVMHVTRKGGLEK